MRTEDLLAYKSDTYSQNGEDGIISRIFKIIGTTTKVCCEFGAWDGVHLSNCRALILDGWRALMIEGDEERFRDLVSNYSENPLVISHNCYVDAGPNSLNAILKTHDLGDLDFLSIDIDGLDYEIFEMLDARPRVICVEVNAGHSPESKIEVDRDKAKQNIGQPLPVFVKAANKKGYGLVCYTGNAFFARNDVLKEASLPELSSKEAYTNFLSRLSIQEREWLYLVNAGIVEPHHRYSNPYLSLCALELGILRAVWLRSRHLITKAFHLLKGRR